MPGPRAVRGEQMGDPVGEGVEFAVAERTVAVRQGGGVGVQGDGRREAFGDGPRRRFLIGGEGFAVLQDTSAVLGGEESDPARRGGGVGGQRLQDADVGGAEGAGRKR